MCARSFTTFGEIIKLDIYVSGSVEVAAAELWRVAAAAVHLCVNGSFIFAHRQIVVGWSMVLYLPIRWHLCGTINEHANTIFKYQKKDLLSFILKDGQ